MIEHPWPHLIIDDYYDKLLVDNMKREIFDHIKTSNISQRQIYYRSTDKQFNEKFPHTLKCSQSIDPYFMLRKFNKHRPYIEASILTEINVIFDGYDYPIHDETPRKILSIVNYIAPEKSTGTLIYNTDKSFVGEIEWRPNRSLIFPGVTGETWHSFKVEPKKIRITLNTFIVNDLD